MFENISQNFSIIREEMLRHESSQDNDWIFKYFNPGAD
jgi:hypothetical protein